MKIYFKIPVQFESSKDCGFDGFIVDVEGSCGTKVQWGADVVGPISNGPICLLASQIAKPHCHISFHAC